MLFTLDEGYICAPNASLSRRSVTSQNGCACPQVTMLTYPAAHHLPLPSQSRSLGSPSQQAPELPSTAPQMHPHHSASHGGATQSSRLELFVARDCLITPPCPCFAIIPYRGLFHFLKDCSNSRGRFSFNPGTTRMLQEKGDTRPQDSDSEKTLFI